MTKPRLYEQYGRQQVIEFFGIESAARTLCDGEWVIFPDVVICLASIGEPPYASHFVNGTTFHWVAQRPYHVNDEWSVNFIPAEVLGSKEKARAMHLFVRPVNSQNYFYIGELERSYMQELPGRKRNGMARFEFRPTLPSKIWMRLGGLTVSETDVTSVDMALDRLDTSPTLEDRLEILKRLVEYWHGPILPKDGIPEADLSPLRLPGPLRWWYTWAGRRNEIMSGQNILFLPRNPIHKYWELKFNGELLEFYVENQGVYQWATLPDGDDPPVFGRYNDDDPWEPEQITLSEHLIYVCIFEAIMCHSKYGASAACLSPDALLNIRTVIPPIAINPWRWPNQTRFHAKNGAFICSTSNGRHAGSVWVGAKTELPLQVLKPYLDQDWEYTAV